MSIGVSSVADRHAEQLFHSAIEEAKPGSLFIPIARMSISRPVADRMIHPICQQCGRVGDRFLNAPVGGALNVSLANMVVTNLRKTPPSFLFTNWSSG
jgi:hypothetical protein